MIDVTLCLAEIYGAKFRVKYLPNPKSPIWILKIISKNDTSFVSIYFNSRKQIDEMIEALEELKQKGGAE